MDQVGRPHIPHLVRRRQRSKAYYNSLSCTGLKVLPLRRLTLGKLGSTLMACDEASDRVFFCLWRSKFPNLISWEKGARRSDRSRMTVELKPGESQESLLKRFRKRVSESGVLSQVRKRRWYVSKSEERRRTKAKAIRRARRRERQKRQRQ